MRPIRLLCLPLSIVLACAAIAADAEKVVLGKLGQALRATKIYASANTRSRVYSKVKAYEYLVLRASNSKSWHRVLLQNGWCGYIRAETVAQLPYDVTMDAKPSSRGATLVASRSRAAVADYGQKFAGTPYKWGGNDPVRGIDCSAFVKFLYGQIGLDLPRTAAEQALVGTPIHRLEDLQSGDRLYFWSSKRGKIGHTGIYLGNGYFVHSSSSRGSVATDYLGSSQWLKSLVAARR